MKYESTFFVTEKIEKTIEEMSDEFFSRIERFLKLLENERLSPKLQSERHQLLKELTSQYGKYYHSQYVESPNPTAGKKIEKPNAVQ